jgi:ATP-dependent Clp protease ATP-binding subunit ClpA
MAEITDAMQVTADQGAGAPGSIQMVEAVSKARSGPLQDMQKSVAYLDFARTIGERAGDLPPSTASALEDARTGMASVMEGVRAKLDIGGVPALKSGGSLDQSIQRITDVRSGGATLSGGPVEDKAFWDEVGAAVSTHDEFNQIKLESSQTKSVVNSLLQAGRGEAAEAKDAKPGDLKTLAQFGVDMVEEAKSGKMKPLIGRDDEVRDAIQVLAKKEENNPIFTGEAGVGKTAIAEGMAQRIAKGDVPRDMQGAQLWSIDMTAITGATPDETAKNFKSVIADVAAARQSGRKVYVFIDEIHTLMKDKQIADTLKPALARGDFPMIGATTSTEFREILKDPALERRFGEIKVGEPKPEEAKSIVRGVKPFYEHHHKVRIDESGVDAAVELTGRYIKDKEWPGKALKALDEASADYRMTLST